MRILATVSTPKHAYIWHHPLRILEDRGHETTALLRDYGETLEVAEGVGLEGPVFGVCKGKGYRRLLEGPAHLVSHLRESRRFRPDLVAGTGVYEAHAGRWLRTPSVALTDTEEAPIQNRLTKHLADHVLVPESFQTNPFGAKTLRFPGYLELAYLHPNHYDPDPGVRDDLGVDDGEAFAVLRFNAMDSVHDRTAEGFTTDERVELVERLAEHGRVFVSSEGWMPPEIRGHDLPIDAHRIHDALAFADLYVGDSGTMQNEAAVLGTPSVRYSHLPPEEDRGNTRDLAGTYELAWNLRDPREAIETAVRVLRDGSPRDHEKRRRRMLEDKIDVASFLAWFLEAFPDSVEHVRSDRAAVLERFRAPREPPAGDPEPRGR